jgi:putative drug exporter of the RND superfamily
MFAAWGRFVYRFRWPVLILSVLSLVGFAVLMSYGGRLGLEEFTSQTEAGRASELIEDELPARAPSFTLIFGSDTLNVTGEDFREEVERALEPLRDEPQVTGIRTAYDVDPASSGEEMNSRDGRHTSVVVELEEASDAELIAAYPGLRDQVWSDSLEVLAAGQLPLNQDFEETTEKDIQRAELVSLPLALALLLVVFGSVVAAGMPLGVGALAVFGGVVGTLLLARFMDVSIYANSVVTMIGLGVAIDYSLFVVSRFREEVRRRAVPEALSRTMATAGRAITFSGLTVAIGLLGLLFFDLFGINSMGVAGTIVVALAVLYGLTFLPALLAILGHRVNAWRLPFVRPERRNEAGHGLLWHRIAEAVMARPWRILLPVVAVLLLVGSPIMHLRLGMGDHTTLPEGSESRQGAELLEEQFPSGGTNPVVVVLDYEDESPLTPEHVDETYEMSRWLADLPNVERVESVVDLDPSITREQYGQILTEPQEQLPAEVGEALERSTGEHITVLTAYAPSRAGTDEARDLVSTIREDHPEVEGEVMVGGQTAFDIDSIEAIKDDAPLAIAFVVGATYVVLFLLLGSVLLPVKAVVMNFLSISASYGALVWIFQDGNLSGLLGFTPNPIDTSIPILMFCILFGLSMDYEVLLLTRIKEEYGRTGDNARAVALGLEKTGRLVTGAAAIMAAVFFSFVLAETTVIKAIGLGMGIAVAVDATIVRALLVPATMHLMGRWNWWTPKPLARLYDRLGLSGSSTEKG